MAVEITWHPDGEDDLMTGVEMRRHLDRLGFTITAHAVPHTGVDTGRLVNSMGHVVEDAGDSLVLRCGSGGHDGVQPVWYALPHWAKERPDPRAPRTPELRGRRIPHPTRPAPTRPWTRALRELGIDYHVPPGGIEA